MRTWKAVRESVNPFTFRKLYLDIYVYVLMRTWESRA